MPLTVLIFTQMEPKCQELREMKKETQQRFEEVLEYFRHEHENKKTPLSKEFFGHLKTFLMVSTLATFIALFNSFVKKIFY